ncbi:Phospholipase DDHD1 [Echinococcus granulosus]|uniref:Phospholipase DDHD1 n=1 Tax=Echinococcus granulosus TaxID=6210 RepID=U6JN68_ECHGR|nr:Phospholipase DDHD1 [Echinococcus granulosus]EUB55450.1 Phospholipase DDHD1 [Echinococcus granulosus]CDS23276.1 phospholipase DDHD1 [Echinococcus granulosus]
MVNSEIQTSSLFDGRVTANSLGGLPFDDSNSIKPTRVRWFYKDEATKRWIPFSGYDSIIIELNYLNLLKTRGSGHSVETVDSLRPLLVREGLYEVDIVTNHCYPVYWESSTGPTDILRGTWFKDPGGPNCVPIDDESMVEQLESTHALLSRRLFDTESIRSDSLSPKLDSEDETGVHTLKFADCHVDWYSLDEVYLYVESASFFIRQKLGMQKVGTRLGRGYHEEAGFDPEPPSFSHLCFVVHGMGQKYLKGSIITACDGIRETSRKLIDSYFPDIRASKHRIQFLPVEWRNSLRLDGNIVNSITLDNLTRLRTFLNCTFMDIMYYTSPLYRHEINQSLRVELNRLYCLFCERHPYFEEQGGKVSILAHSLGCVISYDLITGWIEPVTHYIQPPLYVEKKEQGLEDVPLSKLTRGSNISNGIGDIDGDSEDPSVLLAKLEAAKEVVKCLETQLERRQLKDFAHRSSDNCQSLVFASRLENLFCMGSPLAVYLTLRGVQPGQTGATDTIMPRSKCSYIYNIFHPADPVAYRLEPLLLKCYSSVPPVDIYRCTDASKIPYQIAHAMNAPSLTAQNSAPPGMLYDDQNQSYDSFPGPTSHSLLGYGNSSMDSLNFIGSQFRRRLPLSSLMFGFFRDYKESHTQPTPLQQQTSSPPAQVSVKRHKPSSPPSEPSRAHFCVEDEEVEEEALSHSAATFNFPTSSPSSPLDVCFHDAGALPLSLEYRMDYQLKGSRYESTYLSALTVHTGYWVNADLVMFVLMQCHPDSTPIDSPMTPL